MTLEVFMRWSPRAVHRFTVISYPDGPSTLTVLTRDAASACAVAATVLSGVPDVLSEGVYRREGDAWVYDRELMAAARPRMRPTRKADISRSTTIILAELPANGASVRACALFRSCAVAGLPRSTTIRHLRRLADSGVIRRDEHLGQKVTYALVVKANLSLQ